MNNVQSAANCPTSTPNYQPHKELVTYNGFAWSSQGIVHQSTYSNPGSIENLLGNQ